jgi:hypothetical protein
MSQVPTIRDLFNKVKDRHEKVCRREEALLKELASIQIEKEATGKLVELYENMEYDSIEEERTVTEKFNTIATTLSTNITVIPAPIQEPVLEVIKTMGNIKIEDIQSLLPNFNRQQIYNALSSLKRNGKIEKVDGNYKAVV